MIPRRNKDDSPYARLRAQALAMIQELSGSRWTDFNAHDPGVTILEAAHYALLELQLALERPFDALLAENGAPPYGKFGLCSAAELAEQNPVTPADYEQSIKAGVGGVKRCRVRLAPDGKYRIEVMAEQHADRELLKKQVCEHYHARRCFCEALGETVVTAVDGGKEDSDDDDEDVPSIAPEFAAKSPASAPVVEAAAQAYYSLQNHLPDAYSVSEKGFPAGATPERKALIRQLKAYLLIFDFLTSNVLHQSRTVARLADLSERTPPPYLPDFSVGDMEHLVDPARFAASGLLDVDHWRRQKSRWLDLLYAMYGEEAAAFFADESDLMLQNEKRARLIRRLPSWNAHRFRSFNILQTGQHDAPPVEQLAAAVFGQTVAKVYWVEHILLDDDSDANSANRLTVAAYPTPDDSSRRQYESFMRERLPVHLNIRFLWLNAARHSVFVRWYATWRQRLYEQNRP